MTTRAKRMIKYLEDTLGWTVKSNRKECPKGHFNYGGNFCSECGSKLKTIKDTESVQQVEAAIKYALKEPV
jgi:hypothetical protein